MTALGDNAQRAKKLLASSLVWDNHACLPLRPGDRDFIGQLSSLRDYGIDVVSINVGFGPQALEDHIRMLADFRRWLLFEQDECRLVGSLAELDAARVEGKLGVVFDIEGMGPLDSGDRGLVQLFYDLGVRWMTIAYNKANRIGSGCYDSDGRLTSFGREVIAECNRVGMVVCVSHTERRTALDAIEASASPVIFSHSNASAVYPHRRNISDDMIRACAAKGGVIGVNGVGVFLGDNDDRPATVVDHIEHVLQLVGPDHVGLALDYVFDQQELADYLATMKDTFPDDPSYVQPIRLVAPAKYPEIVEQCLCRGVREDDLVKILGGNWRRIAGQVWN